MELRKHKCSKSNKFSKSKNKVLDFCRAWATVLAMDKADRKVIGSPRREATRCAFRRLQDGVSADSELDLGVLLAPEGPFTEIFGGGGSGSRWEWCVWKSPDGSTRKEFGLDEVSVPKVFSWFGRGTYRAMFVAHESGKTRVYGHGRIFTLDVEGRPLQGKPRPPNDKAVDDLYDVAYETLRDSLLALGRYGEGASIEQRNALAKAALGTIGGNTAVSELFHEVGFVSALAFLTRGLADEVASLREASARLKADFDELRQQSESAASDLAFRSKVLEQLARIGERLSAEHDSARSEPPAKPRTKGRRESGGGSR